MYIYHGSRNQFKEFDLDRMRLNGTMEGVGFYCTDNKEVAYRYGDKGFVMTYIYRGVKRLSSTEVTLTRDELREYIAELDRENEFLSNYGDIDYSGFSNVLNEAVESNLNSSTDDVEIISGICNAFGNLSRPLEILYEVLGYDSSIVEAKWGKQNIYLIFNSSAIEYVETEKVQ